MEKKVEINAYMSQYDILKKYFDTYKILTPEILSNLMLQINGLYGREDTCKTYITRLKSLGCIASTIDGGYMKIKRLPSYGQLSANIFQSSSPLGRKIRAIENSGAFKSLKNGYESIYGKTYNCSTLVLSISAGLSGSQFLAIEHLLGYMETGDKKCLRKLKKLCEISMEIGDARALSMRRRYMPSRFCQLNGFDDTIREIVEFIAVGNWAMVIKKVNEMCEQK